RRFRRSVSGQGLRTMRKNNSIGRYIFSILSILAFTQLFIGCAKTSGPTRPPLTAEQLTRARWGEIVAQAADSEVNFGMWAGDEARNRYYQSTVAATIKQKYGITLRFVPTGDTADIVNKLLNEKGAGKTAGGTIDLVWINGENFRTAKQGGVLWGPFAGQLPNIRHFPAEARQRDFGTAIEG